MLNIHDTNLIITISLLAIGYITSIYLMGLSQVHLISFMGDKSVPRRFAPSVFYPLEHFDIIGFLFFLGTGFGWSKTLEVKNYSISGQSKRLRMFIARHAQVVTCLLWAIIIMFLALFDLGRSMNLFMNLIIKASKNDISLVNELARAFPELSSMSIVIGLFLSSVILFCAANATLHIFLTGIKWLYHKTSSQLFDIGDESYISETFFSIILFMLYGQHLFGLIILFIMSIAKILALIFGIL